MTDLGHASHCTCAECASNVRRIDPMPAPGAAPERLVFNFDEIPGRPGLTARPSDIAAANAALAAASSRPRGEESPDDSDEDVDVEVSDAELDALTRPKK